MPYEYRPFPYRRAPGLDAKEPPHRVVIVGAGPVGLSLAIGLANQGVPCVLLDDNNVVAMGSRAISWAKRSLDIFDRLGIGDKMLAAGVIWQTARTFHREQEVFASEAQLGGDRMPAFVNLQQYYVETFLAERALSLDLIDLRFENEVISLDQGQGDTHLRVRTPDGEYGLIAEYVVASDGLRSSLRGLMNLPFDGENFEENFLVADIETEAALPAERLFWFDPVFHPGQSALMQKQPGGLYRVDLQLGPDVDTAEEAKPENVNARIEKMLGHGDFKLDWVSVTSFQCRRLRNFIEGRVIFAGDSAHVVAPFGARGANSGVEDADNLAWKLAAVLNGNAPQSLLESYNRERGFAAGENIIQSTRASRFMAPGDGIERLFRDQVLALARDVPFARGWVNSGRIGQPHPYLSEAPDDARLPPVTRPGAVAPDAPQGESWLLQELGGAPKLLALNCAAPDTGFQVINAAENAVLRARYLGDAEQAVYLIRPDQVIAARWVMPTLEALEAATMSMWEGLV